MGECFISPPFNTPCTGVPARRHSDNVTGANRYLSSEGDPEEITYQKFQVAVQTMEDRFQREYGREVVVEWAGGGPSFHLDRPFLPYRTEMTSM